jgi:CHAT domain-containing protein
MTMPTDGSASPNERTETIGRFLFAPDWTTALDLVLSEPWLLSSEADQELANVAARFAEQERSDPDMIPLVGAIGLVRERLGRARQVGVPSAFDDLIAIDARFRAIADMRWAADGVAILGDEPQLISDLGLDELRLMLSRAYQHDKSLGETLWNLYGIVLRTRQEGMRYLQRLTDEQQRRAAAHAEQVFAPLRLVTPQQATRQQVEECERAVGLLDRQAGSDLWLEVQARLGSFLLELRDGDRRTNLARARYCYKAMIERHPDESSQTWAAAVCGYANCLVADREGAPAEFQNAIALLQALIAQLRSGPERDRLVIALSCYAATLRASPTGDPDELIERALAAYREQIQVLGSADADPELWGRAHNNLAAACVAKRTGVRSQNIDEAVRALQMTLEVRSRESDPIGRARALRNLAHILPEWTGADSLASAHAMADACLQEAGAIAAEDPRATARPAEWGGLAGETSALDRNLDEYFTIPSTERVPKIEAAIEHHREVLARLSREESPAMWANWKGGLGRLQAVLAHSNPEAIHEAYANLTQAAEAVSPSSNPRLSRSLHAAIGALGHQIGEWNISLVGHANALALSDTLFDEAATPDSRRQELGDMRGYALFAAYAATRLGKLEDAVRLAEHGRGRSMVEAMATAELIASAASPERRREIEAASRRVTALEEELRTIKQEDPSAIAEVMRNRLADFVGADPRLLNIRVTNPGPHTQDRTKDYIRIAPALREARATLRSVLASARGESAAVIPESLDAEAISEVASRLEAPIIYVLPTVYGSAALFVSPGGNLDAFLLDSITSDVTGALLHGTGEKSGYASAAMTGDSNALQTTLPEVLDALRAGVMDAISQRVLALGYDRAVLIPLGSLGLLPLHAATPANAPAFAYAPSARALSRALAARARSANAPPSFLGIGNPSRDSDATLPFAVAEVRAAPQITTWSRTQVLVGTDAALSNVLPALETATHLHFACHGEFRPSEPMESALLLAGEDKLTLHMLLTSGVALSAPRLAVLSACQTANVEFRSLPDEVLGLPSGLLLAGVPGVVATMWPVDDRAAAFFSQRFFEELFVAKREPGAAVAAAQCWLRDASADELQTRVKQMRQALGQGDDEADAALSKVWRSLASRPRDDRPFNSPEFWAAFVHIGV